MEKLPAADVTTIATRNSLDDSTISYHDITMTRILADLPDEDIMKLDARAAALGKSRAALVREAVKLFLVQSDTSNDWIERYAGLWADRTDIGDGVEYQRAMREDRRPYDDI